MKKLKILAFLIGLIALVSIASAATAPLPPWVVAKGVYPTTSTASYLSIWIYSGGNTTLPNSPPSDYGYCLDPSSVLANSQKLNYTVYSTLGTVPPAIGPGNWNAINWILDNSPYDAHVNQSAIWQLNGGAGHYWEPVNKTDVSTLIALATANPGYQPAPGQLYGVILFNSTKYQPLLTGVFRTGTSKIPEFPSIGVPIAALVGMIFVIYFVRQRKD